jgi:hypothetical protein
MIDNQIWRRFPWPITHFKFKRAPSIKKGARGGHGAFLEQTMFYFFLKKKTKNIHEAYIY